MEVKIENIEPFKVAAVEHRGAYNEIGPSFGKLMGAASSKGLVKGDVITMGVYYDNPETTPENELRSEACLITTESGFGDDQLKEKSFPGGKYAIYTHEGDYSTLGDSWGKFIGEILPANSQTPDWNRVCFEKYLNDCSKVKPEELRTEICVPVS